MSRYFHNDFDVGILNTSLSEQINSSVKLSHRIIFNCATITNPLLAVGCNTGNIYLFSMENSKFLYWSNILSNDTPVECMKFSFFKNYFAYINTKLQVFVYKLDILNKTYQIIRQMDNNIYTCEIQTMIFDENSSRLFCGFSNGYVDVIYIPQQTKDYFHIPNENILKLNKQSIVQIDIHKDILLVSTNEKVILFNIQTKAITFIGTKQRSGLFGACFWYADANKIKVIAARPNYRLWIASLDGSVEETQQYKLSPNLQRYRIKESEDCASGTGQFSWVSNFRGDIILAGDSGGIIFLINLIAKTCLLAVDCGNSFKKALYCPEGLLVLNSSRDVTLITICDMKNAIEHIIEENINCHHAIDLFLSLETNGITDHNDHIKKVRYSLSPNLLTLLVQKSAEINYKFVESNRLQVEIRDNDEYQKLFPPNKQNRESNTSELISSGETSIASDMSNQNKPSRTSKKVSSKAPQLLKAIYDKTSSLLSNIEAISSSSSDLHLNVTESFSQQNSMDDLIFKKPSVDELSSNMASVPKLNLMELEANVYIACEKLKYLNDNSESFTDFEYSLSTFCETWLTLNLNYWSEMKNFEFCLRNLSSTYPIFERAGTNSLSQNEISDNFDPHDISHCEFANSWSQTVSVSDWKKPISLSAKIAHMTSDLLFYCFLYQTFSDFPRIIEDIYEIVEEYDISPKSIVPIDSSEFLYHEDCSDKCIQTTSRSLLKPEENIEQQTFCNMDLLNILVNEIWNLRFDVQLLRSMIVHFFSNLNLKLMYTWLDSLMPQNVWLVIMETFSDIYAHTFDKEELKDLENKSRDDLEKIMFACICSENIESLVVVDKIFGILKRFENFNWKLIVETESLHCRDVLHLCLKHNIKLSKYVVRLFSNVQSSVLFSSRSLLIKHIYSQPDILVAFLFSLISEQNIEVITKKNCSCGFLISFNELPLSSDVYSILMDMITWGIHEGFYKNNLSLLNILMNICIDKGFHEGYIELLVGMDRVSDIIKIALQVSNIKVLRKIKECSSCSVLDSVETIINCRRTITDKCCLNCCKPLIHENGMKPLSWNLLCEFIFIDLITEENKVQLLEEVVKRFALSEIVHLSPFLWEIIENLLNQIHVPKTNQMFHFIKSELTQCEDSAKLTEHYLNIYAMSNAQVCGPNWGRIIMKDMICNICGTVLMDSDQKDVVVFCCTHSYHKSCLSDIGCEDSCFLC